MANTRSAKKRIRQNVKRRARNKAVRTRARTFVNRARLAIADDPESAAEAVRQAVSELDRAASKGVIHRNNAARRKRRLMRHLTALEGSRSTEQDEA